MIFKRKSGRLRFLSAILLLFMMAALMTPVYATDSIDSLENDLSSLNSELKKLDKEINSIASEISDMNVRIKTTQEELAIAKGKEEAQYAAMKTRIQYMYENGSTNLLEILLSASSLSDFIRRAEYFTAVSEYDREALEKITDTRNAIAQKELQLTEERENLNSLLKELDKKEAALKSKVQTTSSALEKARKEAKAAEDALKKKVDPVTPPKNESDNTRNPSVSGDYVPNASDLELFAALIECEAGSSYYEGMLAVASVVVNRMNHPSYPNTLRGVILQSGQFPPAYNGKVDRILQRGIKDSCLQAAQDALNGKNNVGPCLQFRSASSGHAGTVIGGNVFF